MRPLTLSAIVLTLFLALPGVAPLAAQLPPYGGAHEFVEDLAQRREATARALGADTVLILWSAPRRVYSADTDYEYRQESNLLYLTGFDEPDTALVLVPGPEGHREFLFVRAKDPFEELWNGPIPSIEEVSARTGIEQVFPQDGTEAFDAFFRGWLGEADETDASQAARAGRSVAPRPGTPVRLMVLGGPPVDLDDVRRREWVTALAGRRPQTTIADARPILQRLRRVKTPYEQRVMRRSVEIAAEAHIEGMKVTRPGRWEYEVEAAIEAHFLRSGAMSWGYPSIVGSGPNATVLHYVKSTRQMQDGELLLVDAGASFQGLTGDVTRTWPVNGRFSPEQRDIYEIVLAALEAGIAAAVPGGTVTAITDAVREQLWRGLLRIGLVVDTDSARNRRAQLDLWFPHGPVHGIGIDVHESVGELTPGVTFVVEPGIYVRPERLALLGDDPELAALADRIRPAVARYAGIGVRIEDSLLMTPAGPEIMSAKAPKTVEAIEAIVGTGP